MFVLQSSVMPFAKKAFNLQKRRDPIALLGRTHVKHLLECDKNTGFLRRCTACIAVQNKKLQTIVGRPLPVADMNHILPCKVSINSLAGSGCSECNNFKQTACLAVSLQARVGQHVQFIVQE